MMTGFSEIRTLEQLRRARQEVVSRRKALVGRLVSDVRDLKDFYTPANIAAGFLRRNSGYFNWADLTLSLVRTLKERLSERRKAADVAEPQETEQQ